MSDKKFTSLAEYYNEYLENLPIGNLNMNTLFEGANAKKLIQNLFTEERKNEKLKNCLAIITDYRAKHTLSAYLLGMTIRDQLMFNTKDWRRLPGDPSPKGSFQLFWAWICLFHDIGYKYETDDEFFNKDYELKDIEKQLDISNSFLAVSEHVELIGNYFTYMRDEWGKFDHGILGAMLLYDALMDISQTVNLYSSIKNVQKFYVKICDAIALHNMWRATEENEELYKKYELFELIPSWDNSHKIYYSDNALLFLLGLVDTIEPFKFFVKDGRYKNPVTPYEVLNTFYIRFIYGSGKKVMNIKCDSERFDEYKSKMKGPKGDLAVWLGVISKETADHTLQIDIVLYKPSYLA